MTIPPLQGATRETDFVQATADEVERRENRAIANLLARKLRDDLREMPWLLKSRTEGR